MEEKWGSKIQISKLTQKWVFDGQTRPKKICILKTNLVSNGRTRRERERSKEEKKRKRKKGDSSQDQANKVWKLTLFMNPMRFGMDPWFCRIIIFPKLGVLLGFQINPKIYVK